MLPEAAAGLLTMPNNQDLIERFTLMEKLQVLRSLLFFSLSTSLWKALDL